MINTFNDMFRKRSGQVVAVLRHEVILAIE